jgi:hypothetical protein
MREAQRFVRARVTKKTQVAPPTRLERLLKQCESAMTRVKRLLRREPDSPEDPYSYVGAPRKPILPQLRAAAAAELER